MSPDSHAIVLSPSGSSTRSVTMGVAATVPPSAGIAAEHDIRAARCRSVRHVTAQIALRCGLLMPCNAGAGQGCSPL